MMDKSSSKHSYIDCHVHILPPKRSEKLIKWARSFMADHPIPPDISVADIVNDLKSQGAQRCVNLLYPLWENESRELNKFGARLNKEYPEAITFGGVSASDSEPLSVVKEAIGELGLAGIKFHPMVQHFSPAEEKLKAIYPYLEKYGCGVYIHTGFDEWYNWRLPLEDLEWIVRMHPGLTVVFSHSCFPRLKWAFELAQNCPNLWLDMTNVFGSMAMLEKWGTSNLSGDFGYLELKKILLDEIPRLRERIIFGTDHPAGIGSVKKILDDFLEFGLDDETIEWILLKAPRLFMKQFDKN